MKVVCFFCSILFVLFLFGCCEESPNLQRGREQPSATIAESSKTYATKTQPPLSDKRQEFHFLQYTAPTVTNGGAAIAVASSDFDQDGVPDVAVGYATAEKGVLIIHHGIVTSKDPRDFPFSETGSSIEISLHPELLASGDFDNDGNIDLAVAAKGENRICWLKGNGKGELHLAQELTLPGQITTLFTADTNRHDGRMNLIAGGHSSSGSHVVVLDGQNGAFSAEPEIFDLPSDAIAFAAEDFDQDYWIDLAVATETKLMILYGSDRRSSSAVRVQSVTLPFQIRSIVSGRFTHKHYRGLAMLSDSGKVHLLVPEKKKKNKIKWDRRSLARGLWPDSSTLIRARVTGNPLDDLILVDQRNLSLNVIASTKGDRYALQYSLQAEAKPVAVLPVRLNRDALSDLIILEDDPNKLFSIALTQPQATYQVNLTSDESDANLGDGVCDIDIGTAGDQCTLRAAIQQANSNAGADVILFLSNVTNISPLIPLPAITDPVQMGASQGPQRTFISGANVIVPAHGLQISAGDSLITDIGINGFDAGVADCGIGLDTNGNNVIFDVYLGTDEAGASAVGNRNGICVLNSPDNEILENLISGNFVNGVQLGGNNTTGTVIRDNLIGTDVTGTQPLGNGSHGINSLAANSHTVEGNVISANGANGVLVNNGSLIYDSKIGTDATGTVSLGNALLGISIVGSNNSVEGSSNVEALSVVAANGSGGISILGDNNRVFQSFVGTNLSDSNLGNSGDGILIQNGSDNRIDRNTIAFNGSELGNGIRVIGNGAQRNEFAFNSIHSNLQLGIDLGGDGVTPNDAGDADSGPNDLQNFPVLTSAEQHEDIVSILGTLHSLPNTEFSIDIFSSPTCDPSGFGEGLQIQTSGLNHQTTDANGDVSFQISISLVPVGTFLTAVVTRREGDFDIESSEFSSCIQVQAMPPPDPMPSCTLAPAFASLELGEEISVKATVLDSSGNPVDGAPITFYVSGSGGSWYEHTTTDSLGEAFTSELYAIVPFHVWVSADADTSEGLVSCGSSSIEWVLFCEEVIAPFNISANLKELPVQHPRLQEYRKRFAPFLNEITASLSMDTSLLFRTNDVLSKLRGRIDALSEQTTQVIDSTELQMVNDLLVAYAEQASPQLRKELEKLQTDLQNPKIQREIGFIVARKPMMEVEQ
jgi:CSLREA domain-containing protein